MHKPLNSQGLQSQPSPDCASAASSLVSEFRASGLVYARTISLAFERLKRAEDINTCSTADDFSLEEASKIVTGYRELLELASSLGRAIHESTTPLCWDTVQASGVVSGANSDLEVTAGIMSARLIVRLKDPATQQHLVLTFAAAESGESGKQSSCVEVENFHCTLQIGTTLIQRAFEDFPLLKRDGSRSFHHLDEANPPDVRYVPPRPQKLNPLIGQAEYLVVATHFEEQLLRNKFLGRQAGHVETDPVLKRTWMIENAAQTLSYGWIGEEPLQLRASWSKINGHRVMFIELESPLGRRDYAQKFIEELPTNSLSGAFTSETFDDFITLLDPVLPSDFLLPSSEYSPGVSLGGLITGHPVQATPVKQMLLENVGAVITASDFERLALMAQYSFSSQKHLVSNWKAGEQHFWNLGNHPEPVIVEVNFALVKAEKVLFVSPAGNFINNNVIERWIEEQFPRALTGDAHSFPAMLPKLRN